MFRSSSSRQGCQYSKARGRFAVPENTIFGSKIAFSFEDGYVDFDRLLSRNVQAQIASNGNFISGERSALIPLEYRAFCSDVTKGCCGLTARCSMRTQAWQSSSHTILMRRELTKPVKTGS